MSKKCILFFLVIIETLQTDLSQACSNLSNEDEMCGYPIGDDNLDKYMAAPTTRNILSGIDTNQGCINQQGQQNCTSLGNSTGFQVPFIPNNTQGCNVKQNTNMGNQTQEASMQYQQNCIPQIQQSSPKLQVQQQSVQQMPQIQFQPQQKLPSIQRMPPIQSVQPMPPMPPIQPMQPMQSVQPIYQRPILQQQPLNIQPRRSSCTNQQQQESCISRNTQQSCLPSQNTQCSTIMNSPQNWQQFDGNMCEQPGSFRMQRTMNDMCQQNGNNYQVVNRRDRFEDADSEDYVPSKNKKKKSNSGKTRDISKKELEDLLKGSIFIVDPKSDLNDQIKKMIKNSEKVKVIGKNKNMKKKKENDDSDSDETQNVFQDASYPTKNNKKSKNKKSSKLTDKNDESTEENEEEEEPKIQKKKSKKKENAELDYDNPKFKKKKLKRNKSALRDNEDIKIEIVKEKDTDNKIKEPDTINDLDDENDDK